MFDLRFVLESDQEPLVKVTSADAKSINYFTYFCASKL